MPAQTSINFNRRFRPSRFCTGWSLRVVRWLGRPRVTSGIDQWGSLTSDGSGARVVYLGLGDVTGRDSTSNEGTLAVIGDPDIAGRGERSVAVVVLGADAMNSGRDDLCCTPKVSSPIASATMSAVTLFRDRFSASCMTRRQT